MPAQPTRAKAIADVPLPATRLQCPNRSRSCCRPAATPRRPRSLYFDPEHWDAEVSHTGIPPGDDPVRTDRGRRENKAHAAVFLSDFHLSDGTAGGDDFLESHLRPEEDFRGLLTGFFPPGESRARLVSSALTLAFRRVAARTGRSELPDVVFNGDVIDFLAHEGSRWHAACLDIGTG